MTPWVFSQALVAIAEFILAIFGFVLLSDLHDILQFYNSAWSLAVRDRIKACYDVTTYESNKFSFSGSATNSQLRNIKKAYKHLLAK